MLDKESRVLIDNRLVALSLDADQLLNFLAVH